MYLCIVKLLEVKHDKSLNITDAENQAHVENMDAMAYITLSRYVLVWVSRERTLQSRNVFSTFFLCCYYIKLLSSVRAQVPHFARYV